MCQEKNKLKRRGGKVNNCKNSVNGKSYSENKRIPYETYAMGAKTQVNAKESNEKRPSLRCDDCDRDFLSVSAFKSHTSAKHPEKYKQMLSEEPDNKDEKKTALVPPTSRASKRLQQKKSVDKGVATETANRKTIFQCPKCLKEFGVFFPAVRHIQNRHCVDINGEPVSADSPDLIKPIRKEICTLCDKSHPGVQTCDASTESSDGGSYCCLACKEVYPSVASFDEHVEVSHNDSVTVVILDNKEEFLDWKRKIETKQRVKYLTLSNTTQKQYYQCNYVSPQNSAHITHLCPAVMIAREFSKGLHIRYYKDHYEHTCEEYIHQPSNTTTIPNKPKDTESFEDLVKTGKVYAKLKELMKNITQKASTVDKTKLKPLYVAALEMQDYLNSLEVNEKRTPLKKQSISNSVAKTKDAMEVDDDNGDEDENTEPKPNKSMTDDQIVKALEGTRASNRLKRKSESSPAPEKSVAKKIPKTSKTDTDLKENHSDADLACEERFDSPKSVSTPFSPTPSFNDTYKQFIDSTSPKVEKEKIGPKRVKKEVVKTRIGQFTPSPKKSQLKVEPEVVSKKKKMGPAKSTPLKDLKLEDVEYEVVEQENDCNILILKI